MNEYKQNNDASVRLTDGFSERVAEKIEELKNYKSVHGSAVGYGDAYKNTLMLISQLSDKAETQTMETKLTNIVYYDDTLDYDERRNTDIDREDMMERAKRNNDPLLIADILTEILNEWDLTPEASANGLEYMENVGLPRLYSIPESHAKHVAIGKILFWGHFCSYLTVLRDLPKAKAALGMAIAETAPHVMLCESANTDLYNSVEWYASVYACMLAAEKALGKIEARGDVGLPYKVQITSQSWKKTADNIRLIHQPGCSYYNQCLGWFSSLEKYHVAPLMDANFTADYYFFPHTDEVGVCETVTSSTRKKQSVTQSIVSRSEYVEVPAGIFDNCLHIHREDDGGTFHDFWYAYGVGLIKYAHNNKMYRREEGGIEQHSPIVLERYNISGGSGYLPAALGNSWRYVCEGAPEDIEAYAEYEIAFEAGDTAYLTCVSEYIDPRGGPGFTIDD